MEATPDDPQSVDRLITDYWLWYGLEITRSAEDLESLDLVDWSCDAADDLSDHPDPVWATSTIRRLVDSAPSIDAARFLGAGPLEYLVFRAMDELRETGLRSVLDAVVNAARESEAFRATLAIVHDRHDDPPDGWHQIDAILGSAVSQRHRRRT